MIRLKTLRKAIIGVVMVSCIAWVITWQFKGTVYHKQLAVPTVGISRRHDHVPKMKTGVYENNSYQSTEHAKKLKESSEMKARIKHVRKMCKANISMKKTRRRGYLNNIVVDQINKILFCYIPKVANTNFRRIYLATTGVVSKEKALNMSGRDIYRKYQHKFVTLGRFSYKKRRKMLESYNKIMFVREPLEKLLSGYKNKYFHPNIINRNLYYNLILNFYRNISIPGKKRTLAINATTRTITFTQFLTYWTDVFEMRGRNINPHFALSSDLCMPCTVPYDFIGKFDTLDDDVEFIYNELNMDVQFPKRNDNYSAKSTVDIVEDYYKEVPPPLLARVRKYLSTDFDLFGYPVPDWMS